MTGSVDERLGRMGAKLEAMEDKFEKMESSIQKMADSITDLTQTMLKRESEMRGALWVLGGVASVAASLGAIGMYVIKMIWPPA